MFALCNCSRDLNKMATTYLPQEYKLGLIGLVRLNCRRLCKQFTQVDPFRSAMIGHRSTFQSMPGVSKGRKMPVRRRVKQ
jgi:hypothetical protein